MCHSIATEMQNTKHQTKNTGMLTTKEWSYLKDLETIQNQFPENGQYVSRPGNKSSSKLAFSPKSWSEIVLKLQSQVETVLMPSSENPKFE